MAKKKRSGGNWICTSCREQVQGSASRCPHCTEKITEKIENDPGLFGNIFMGIAAFVAGLIFFAFALSAENPHGLFATSLQLITGGLGVFAWLGVVVFFSKALKDLLDILIEILYSIFSAFVE